MIKSLRKQVITVKVKHLLLLEITVEVIYTEIIEEVDRARDQE